MKTRDRDKPDEGNVGRPNGEDWCESILLERKVF